MAFLKSLLTTEDPNSTNETSIVPSTSVPSDAVLAMRDKIKELKNREAERVANKNVADDNLPEVTIPTSIPVMKEIEEVEEAELDTAVEGDKVVEAPKANLNEAVRVVRETKLNVKRMREVFEGMGDYFTLSEELAVLKKTTPENSDEHNALLEIIKEKEGIASEVKYLFEKLNDKQVDAAEKKAMGESFSAFQKYLTSLTDSVTKIKEKMESSEGDLAKSIADTNSKLESIKKKLGNENIDGVMKINTALEDMSTNESSLFYKSIGSEFKIAGEEVSTFIKREVANFNSVDLLMHFTALPMVKSEVDNKGPLYYFIGMLQEMVNKTGKK